jgi:carboxyl-terminal processing protease
MFLAPPLAPEKKRRSLILRAFSRFGLLTTLVLLLAVNVLLVYAHYFLVIPTVQPKELYHRAWQMARDNLYDQSRLREWDKWEHKYDDKIETEEDAIKYINEMIGSLQEVVTGFLDARTVQSASQHADEHLIGVGIVFDLQTDGSGQLKTNAQGKAMPVVSADGYPLVKHLLRGSPASGSVIKPGDAIATINGRQTVGLSIEELTGILHGQPGTSVELELKRLSATVRETLTRAEVSIPIVTTRRLPGNIGFIRLETFDRWDTADQMQAALEELADCDAYVIDVRDNTGGFIHSATIAASLFLDSGTITTIDSRIPEGGFFKYSFGVHGNSYRFELQNGPLAGWGVKVPRRFGRALAELPGEVLTGRFDRPKTPHNLTGKKPIVILVSDWTASAAELFTAALKDNDRATVVGIKTYGKAIGQVFVPVGNGARLRITNQKLWRPNGDWIGDCGMTVSNGVVPDVIVQPTANANFGDETDTQLRVAVEILAKKLGQKP